MSSTDVVKIKVDDYELDADYCAKPLVALKIGEFLDIDIPPTQNLLTPWLKTQSLNMVHAWRGVGKTYFAINIAYAVASGGKFLAWSADKPRGVLYLDGEMPAAAMQERFGQIVPAADTDDKAELAGKNLKLITPDLQPVFMPDLATGVGQRLVNDQIDDSIKLIVVDNLSSLVRRGGKENEPESWLSVGEWAMAHRAAGVSILFVHHSGKNLTQRGTSKREDFLDTVICLRHPSDYKPEDGARFEIEFEKDRHKAAGEPIEAQLTIDQQNRQKWTIKPVEGRKTDQVIEMYVELGMPTTDIANELGMNKSTVYRKLLKERIPIRGRGKKPGNLIIK